MVGTRPPLGRPPNRRLIFAGWVDVSTELAGMTVMGSLGPFGSGRAVNKRVCSRSMVRAHPVFTNPSVTPQYDIDDSAALN